MNDLTYIQQRKEKTDDKQTETWLRSNGITKQQFSDLDTGLLQAKRVATNLLKNHARLLAQNQAHTLNNYLQAMSNGTKRKKITQAQALKILNIGTEVNRKLFKQLKKK